MFSLDFNPYEILGVSERASELDIRRARRKLVLKYPNEMFPKRAQEINEAYQLLSNRTKRRQVDGFLNSKAGCVLKVQSAFLSDEIRKSLLEYPDRSKVFELFKPESPVEVGRQSLIKSLLSLTRGAE
ncbi:J domain-containing protein [bacterium]|nr:J domain-containing protein [bacterium]